MMELNIKHQHRRHCFLKRWQMAENVYKSDLTPKPGPLGGSVSEVRPPAGSHEKRPPLAKTEAKEKF